MVKYSKTIPYRWLNTAPAFTRHEYHTLQDKLEQLAPTGLQHLNERLIIAKKLRTIQRAYNPALPLSCVLNFCEHMDQPVCEATNEI